MPRKPSLVPKYLKFKPRNLAYCRVNGKVIYLGKFGSPESRQAHARILAELASAPEAVPTLEKEEDFTINELVEAYWNHCQQYYRKQDRPTGHVHTIRIAARHLVKLYGFTAAGEFSPKSLKAVRGEILKTGVSRGYVNSQISIIRRMFKWAAGEELIPKGVYRELCTVEGLKEGRTTAPDRPPVAPVADAVADATLPYLPPAIAAMVEFQRLTGCRPGEVCQLRPIDLDRSSEIWKYSPATHKTEHHHKSRLILIGPKAQAILLPYLDRPDVAYCFDPRETVEALRSKRKTPSRSRKKDAPKRTPGQRYKPNAYLWAVKRAVARANKEIQKQAEEMGIEKPDLLPEWHPNQLRHSAATAIRKLFGLESARVILGHSKAGTTEIYAEKDLDKAIEIVRKIG